MSKGKEFISQLKLYTDYLKWDDELNRYETWNEACDKVLDTHIKRYGEKVRRYVDEVKESYYQKEFLSSQRNLQFRGDLILKNNAKLYNCCTTYCYSPDVFGKGLFVLLSGVGLGVSMKRKFVSQLPNIEVRDKGVKMHVIEDSIEGWADAARILISSYCQHPSLDSNFFQYQVKFDYSLIRPKGAMISGGFKAPGSEGLKQSLERIESLMNNSVGEFKSIVAYDIFMHLSDSVLSGGVRRCIAKGSKLPVKVNGFKNIEDVKIGDEVLTLNGWKTVTNFFDQGEQPTMKIVHQNGVLTCTKNHKIAVIDGNSVKWKLAGDLNKEDKLIFTTKIDKNNNESSMPIYSYDKPLHSTTCKNIVIPKLDEEIAYLIGVIQGDGYVRLDDNGRRGELSIAIEGNNYDKVVKLDKIVKRFGINTSLQQPSVNDNCYKLKVKSQQLSEYLSEHVKQANTTLVIPEFIKRSDNTIQMAYVAGVFCADGSCKTKPLNCCTSVYRPFLEELQQLLCANGVMAYIKELGNRKGNLQRIFALYVAGSKNVELFKSLVGESYKQEGIIVPKEKNGCRYFNQIENKQPIKIVDLIYDDELCHTYDIEVQDEHSFVCEGILVHNSAMNILMDEDDSELVNVKIGNWRQTHPWRARSNNSIGLTREKFSKEQFEQLVALNVGDNDLGFVFISDEDEMFNPCFTINQRILTTDGWRTFKELIGTTPEIIQDNRVQGRLIENREEWFFDYNKKGVTTNKTTKVVKTGEDRPVFKLITVCGREVEATENHHFATKRGMVELKNLTECDEILIGIPNESYKASKDSYDYILGLLYGLYYGDGTNTEGCTLIDIWLKNEESKDFLDSIENMVSFVLANNGHELISYANTKTKPKFHLSFQEKDYSKHRLNSALLYQLFEKEGFIKKPDLDYLHYKSKDFKAGFASGFIYTDGHIDFNEKSKSISIRIVQSDFKALQNVQLVLQELGIFSKIYKGVPPRNVIFKTGQKEYLTKQSHRLVISNVQNCRSAMESLTLFSYKKDRYNEIMLRLAGKRKLRNFTKVKSVEYLRNDDVYCLEENNQRTLIVEGLTARRCFEIGFNFYSKIKNLNEAVYQFCNLCEISASACSDKKGRFSEEKFYELCHKAAIVGTLQAGYTSFPYLGKQTEEIVAGESLLGVSVTGWMTRPELYNEEILRKGAKIVKETNKEVAKFIGINQSARTTTVKPSGNASVILKTAPGIHPEHSKRYFRIMQLNKESDTAKHLLQHCPEILEESAWSSTKTDYVVYSPCENADGTIYKEDMQGVKHLKLIELVQNSWVSEGKNEELCYVPTTNHNVSNTVIIDNQKEIVDYIFENQKNFSAVSFLSLYGDKDYNQAPFTSVLNTEELIEKYGDGAIFMAGLIVDGLHYFNDDLWTATRHVLDKTTEVTGTREQVLLKKDWIRRVKQFAKNYYKNDMDKTIYCMKDVHLWHKWVKISRRFNLIDYPSILSKPEFTDINTLGAIACSGGQCELKF